MAGPGVKKLRPADVASLKGLSGEAWNKKLEQLVSTVKSEQYSRAPSTATAASLLIDSTSQSAALGGRADGRVDHRDPSSAGARGSFFSMNPPPSVARAQREHMENMRTSAELFQIARVVDGAVYGAKAYGTDRRAIKPRTKEGAKILDKFAMDAEEMLHVAAQLRKEVAAAKADLATLSRERELLDAHLEAQNRVLDAQALKKGFVRVSGSGTASHLVVEKPRFEKIAPGGAARGGHVGAKLSLEEQLLTLQVQHKSLCARKARLKRELESAADEHGNLPASADADAEAARERKRILLAEIHQLQQSMLADKAAASAAADAQDALVHELRHQAGLVQAQLEVQRTALTNATLHAQQQTDRRAAMQAKIAAIRYN